MTKSEERDPAAPLTPLELGRVLRSGADRARGWSYNTTMQQIADIMESMAATCEEIQDPSLTETRRQAREDREREVRRRQKLMGLAP